MQLLKSRGLVISDEDKCLGFLHSVNYYLFSAYLLPFKQSNGNYERGTSFETVLRIFEFDRKFRSLLFTVVEEIELFLRAQLSYYSAHAYGPHGYLDAKHYSIRHDHNRFMKTVNTAINNNRNTPVVMHHNAKYNGLFPIWVIVDYFSIGNHSYFYTDWLVKDKKNFAKDLFGATYPFLDSWMKCITVLRNRCAHYSRLYFSLFTDLPKIPTKLNYKCTGRVFDQLMMLKLLYINKARWNTDFVLSLNALIIEYRNDICFAHIGFPENWQELLEFDSHIN